MNVRIPTSDRDELRDLAVEAGVSVNALLGSIVHAFLDDHPDRFPDAVLADARSTDSHRRRRPHLERLHRHK